MRTFRILRVSVGLAAFVVGVSETAAAQSDDLVFPALQWNFSTPGARAKGMGGSFIGLADDATAAVTNPAGLVSLTRPQLYLEYKNTKIKTDRLALVDALVTRRPTTFESTVNSLSFLSVSAPVGGKLAVGFSIHRFLDYHETFNIAPQAVPNTPSEFVLFPVEAAADFIGTSFSGSVAYQVMPALRVGLTLGGNRLESDSIATRRGILAGPTYPANRNDLSTSNILVNQTSIDDTQNAYSASIGALYKVKEMVTIGVDYTRSPRFKTSENRSSNAGFNNVPRTNLGLVTDGGFPKQVAINVPDHFGVGVSIRPMPRLLVAADVMRVRYSSLSEDTTLVLAGPPLTGSVFSTPDVTEVHVGGEYNVFNLLQKYPLFVRAGVFTNPNHLMIYSNIGDPTIDAVENALYNFLERKDDTRGTVGAGVVFGTRFQVDAAYVFGREFVASTGVRF